ncbi:MAG: 23S rRNA (uracil(1939)-C(5))-methyltransferase RlmD [Flavobacteriales bacterium]|nr:23S rRNA (uracil(1939)-C(5))-methyltransferase RlmD [Flavobacteriales bacterium]
MSRSKKPLPVWEAVPVTGYGANGKAIAKRDGLVIFISGAVPGDVADLRITKKKSKWAEATAVRIVERSPDRVDAFCKHFGLCGGCKWQDLSYPKQLAYKQQEVVDHLVRLGGLELPPVSPILAAQRTTHYRNKLEYTASAFRWFTSEELRTMGEITDRNALGFHVPGGFDKVLQVDECHLQPEPSDSVRNFIRRHAGSNGPGFYDIRNHRGWLRTVMVRTTTTGECMVLVAFGEDHPEAQQLLLTAVHDAFPAVTSLLWTINPKKNDTIWDLDIHTFHGVDHVIEELMDDGHPNLRFRIGAKSFFQTNPEQTQHLYELVRSLARLTGKEKVYDLYCGAGSISLFLARHCGEVIGAEIVPEAVVDAERNAALNSIGNVTFEAGDLKDLLNDEFIARHGRPDVLITDPPRAGMHEDVVARIRELAPPVIVYVSCNSATQARDLALLKDQYRITHVQPVDMFPHTYHVENVVRLQERNRPSDAKP